tara:strand:+ start:3977 stop:4285 length:309 start_codon:yes stop_codon:yes gene_type:complete
MMTLSVTGVIAAGIAAAAAVGAGTAATEVAAGAEGACVAAAGAPTLVSSSSSPSLEQAVTNTNAMTKTIGQTMNFNASRFGMSSSPLFCSMSTSDHYPEKAA